MTVEVEMDSFKREISNFIIYKQTLAFRFLLDYNRLV